MTIEQRDGTGSRVLSTAGLDMTFLADTEHRDCTMRALNNAALAKNDLLAGNTAEAMRHIDAALTWSFPLLGMEHPMSGAVAHVSQPPLLRHEGSLHQGRWFETPNDHSAKRHPPLPPSLDFDSSQQR